MRHVLSESCNHGASTTHITLHLSQLLSGAAAEPMEVDEPAPGPWPPVGTHLGHLPSHLVSVVPHAIHLHHEQMVTLLHATFSGGSTPKQVLYLTAARAQYIFGRVDCHWVLLLLPLLHCVYAACHHC